MRVGFFCSWIPPTNTLLERLLILAEELKYVIHTGIFFPTELRKVAFTHPTYCLIYFLGGGTVNNLTVEFDSFGYDILLLFGSKIDHLPDQ